MAYAILPIISFIIALILTPLLRWMAEKKGFLDNPGKRRVHKEAVPRVGGVAIAISFLLMAIISFIFYKTETQEKTIVYMAFLFSGLIVLFWGLWDDIKGMKARRKYLGQLIGVLILISSGFIIRRFSIPYLNGFTEVGWWLGIPLTLFWITGITNTINFIDGIDGLAAGTTIIISLALFIISAITGQAFMALVCLILAGSIMGFFRYNFHPATIFMGDCGAMFLGYILAIISIPVVFHNQSITASSVVPVMLFGLPIADSTWAIIRRISKGESPSHADDLHTHHRLIALGFSQRKVAFILYFANILSASGGIVVALSGSNQLAVIIPIILLCIASIGIFFLTRKRTRR
ncbi:undecaprenyl/decaprenyl-phosphate alpha-N-acetylglucosaminyl 1-phosphate transferase [Candidatus Poribacteria bacterium]|nr:undecaprenyl/decaprenyl-phosphate alpha-N-acetylglucosaminyl 1-phosphate transferase [Candidatus Poribacteria bacterium]